MVKAQRRVDALHTQLAAETDHLVLTKRGDELTAAQRQLDDCEASWLELAEQAEAVQ